MNDKQFVALLVNKRTFNKLSMAHIAIKIEKLNKFLIIEKSDEVKRALEIIDKLDEKELDKCVLKLINCIKNKQYIDNLSRRGICRIGYKVIKPMDIVKFYVNLDFYNVEYINNNLIIKFKFEEGKTKMLQLKQLVYNKEKDIKEHCEKLGYRTNSIKIEFVDYKGIEINESLYDAYGNKIKTYKISDVIYLQEKLKEEYDKFREFFINDIVRLTEESIENDERFILKEDERIDTLIKESTDRLNNNPNSKVCIDEIKLFSNELNKIKKLYIKFNDVPF